jgi:hypothetical protein
LHGGRVVRGYGNRRQTEGRFDGDNLTEWLVVTRSSTSNVKDQELGEENEM